MKTSIKVEELVCLSVVSENGPSTAIPLEPVHDPNTESKLEVFVNESKDLIVVRHIPSGDSLVMDCKGSIIDNETLAKYI